MKLSIVIPTYNRPDLLRACLASVHRFAPPQTEVVVVDDASPTPASFPGVRVLRLPQRRGFCGAVNAGIAATTSPIVELLNDDTEATAGWTDAAMRCFDDPQVAAVAPLVLFPDGTIDSAGDEYDCGGFARKIRDRGKSNRSVFGASGSSAFYRRSFLDRVGPFPEPFGSYFEDVDLSFRLQRAGGTVLYEPESRVIHHGGSSHRVSRQLVEQQSCNEERVYWRNLPTAEIARTLPRHVAVLVAKAVRRWNEGRLVPWACGRARAWSEFIACRRHQRQLAAIGPPRRLTDWGVGRLSATPNRIDAPGHRPVS